MYCKAVTLSFASSYGFLLSLWSHCFSFFPIQKKKQGRNMGAGEGVLCVEEAEGQETKRGSEKQDFPDLSFRSCFHFLRSKYLDYIVFTMYGLCVAWQLSEIILQFCRGSCSKCTWVLQNPILLNYFLKVWSALSCLFLTYGNKTVTFPFLFVKCM